MPGWSPAGPYLLPIERWHVEQTLLASRHPVAIGDGVDVPGNELFYVRGHAISFFLSASG